MKYKYIFGIVIGLLSILFSEYLWAETFYINQSPSAILYDNPSEQAAILMQLPKGVPVELLKTNLENGFSYVQTGKGDKGWLRTEDLTEQWVQKEPNFIERFFKKISSNVTSPSASKAVQGTGSSRQDVPQASTLSSDTSSISDNQTVTHATSSLTFQQLRMNYKLMLFNRSQITALDLQVKDLQNQINQLRGTGKSERGYWFMMGAGTALLGLIIGLLLGRRGRYQNRWIVKQR